MATSQEPRVSVKDFTKRYGKVTAVDGISFQVFPGEIFGLLGPNGSGKTSTLESLEGLRDRDGGSMLIEGMDPMHQQRNLRQITGVQLQSSGLHEHLTVKEAMQFFCAYHRVPPAMGVLERFGLTPLLDRTYGSLSTGQRRRLTLAIAIAHDPRVLILDEPTAGLDVQTRVELHAVMRELRAAGTAIILATHDMAEAESLADRIAILLQGRIVTSGTPKQVTAAGAGITKISVRTHRGSLDQTEITLPGLVRRSEHDQYHIFYAADIGPAVAELIAWIERAGDTIEDLRVERPSLEDRFLELTNIPTGGRP